MKVKSKRKKMFKLKNRKMILRKPKWHQKQKSKWGNKHFLLITTSFKCNISQIMECIILCPHLTNSLIKTIPKWWCNHVLIQLNQHLTKLILQHKNSWYHKKKQKIMRIIRKWCNLSQDKIKIIADKWDWTSNLWLVLNNLWWEWMAALHLHKSILILWILIFNSHISLTVAKMDFRLLETCNKCKTLEWFKVIKW